MAAIRNLESRGLAYWLKNKLYISLTNKVNSTPAMLLKGPSFQMPVESKFKLLDEGFEPDAAEIFQLVDHAFDNGLIGVSSMESEEITFAGYGEPLLRYELICESAEMIKMSRHGVPLRVRTNGLVHGKDCSTVASNLKKSGIKLVSVGLMSDNPKQHAEIMKPTNGANFGDVCSFVIACAEAGLKVTCTAVEQPGVNIHSVRNLAQSLGAADFKTYPYFK